MARKVKNRYAFFSLGQTKAGRKKDLLITESKDMLGNTVPQLTEPMLYLMLKTARGVLPKRTSLT